MARNPFWDVSMNCSKFSACLTTQTLENQSFLNQNFVKSCWMSAEGYSFFLIKVCLKNQGSFLVSSKSRGRFSKSCEFFFFILVNQHLKNVYQMFKVVMTLKLKVKDSFLHSSSVTKRDKKLSLMKIFRFLSFLRFICSF